MPMHTVQLAPSASGELYASSGKGAGGTGISTAGDAPGELGYSIPNIGFDT